MSLDTISTSSAVDPNLFTFLKWVKLIKSQVLQILAMRIEVLSWVSADDTGTNMGYCLVRTMISAFLLTLYTEVNGINYHLSGNIETIETGARIESIHTKAAFSAWYERDSRA